ncbi:MAG: type II secretion system major pseudopilin GspG [Planctomycetota bacterium]
MKHNCNLKGFTLIELLLVAVIISILSTIVVVNVLKQKPLAEKAKVDSDLANIGTALNLYSLNNGNYPINEQGLKALMEKPSPVPPNWNGPYLENNPIDSWKNEYQYRFPGEHNKNKYDLWSMGPDGQNGTEDDIGNWAK